MSKKITQKIKEMLTPEDLKVFESVIENMIKDRVAKKVNEQVALKEEAMKKEFAVLSEEFCTKEVTDRLEKEKAKLVEKYDKTLVNLETKIVSRLDSFLESTINEQISDEMLEKIAINETLLPLVNTLREAFAKHYVEIDSTGEKTIKDLKEKAEKKEKELSESIAQNMEYEEKLEKAGVLLMISEKTGGLTESEKAHVVSTFVDRKFEEVDEKIDDFITVLKEGAKKGDKKKKKLTEKVKPKKAEQVISENDGIAQPKKTVVKPEVINEEKKTVTMTDLANQFIY